MAEVETRDTDLSKITAEDLSDISISTKFSEDKRTIEIRVSAIFMGQEYGLSKILRMSTLCKGKYLEIQIRDCTKMTVKDICDYIEQKEGAFRIAIKKGLRNIEQRRLCSPI